jgi:type IV fimbrial biogenesis protein FimT
MLMRAGQRGFNLVEALVTVSVLGILMATTVPSMSDWISSTRVRSLAEATQNGLQKARAEAMKRNRLVTFWLVSPPTTSSPDSTCTLSAASAAWVVSLDDPTGKCGTAPSTTADPRIVQVYGPGQTADRINVTAVDSDGTAATSVSFNGYGQRVGAGISTIDLVHTRTSIRPLRVQVTTTGSVRMCDPVVTAADPNDPRACR